MTKRVLCVLLTFCCVQTALCAEDIATCYRKATNKAQYQECLKDEYKALKSEYNDVLERVLTEAQSADRVRSHKVAAKALNEANKAFDKYLASECSFLDTTSSKTTGKTSVELSCKINLMRVRMGSLKHIYLNPQ